MTIFATVGFGDISPQSEAARLLTSGQMILDLIILGLGVRIILEAVAARPQSLVRRSPARSPLADCVIAGGAAPPSIANELRAEQTDRGRVFDCGAAR